MKSNTNSFLNKIGDVNSDIMNLNRKLMSVDSLLEKFDNNLKDESALRQNIEKKTFLMNETFNQKFNMLTKGFEDITTMMTTQLDEISKKFVEQIQNKNEDLEKVINDSVKKSENCDKKYNDLFSAFTLLKSESNSKILQLQEGLQLELKDIKKEVSDNNIKIQFVEKKFSDNLILVRSDLNDLIRDAQMIKNEIEMVKNFKENTILNFKDISGEFVKNEENMLINNNKISLELQQFESKINLFEQSFNLQNDSYTSLKKELYNQIYDANSNINNKLLKMNENIFGRLEVYEKTFNAFQSSIIYENEKFTSYVNEQVGQNYKSMKKMLEFSNEDLDLIKNKTNHLEELMKNLRGEFFNNLTEVEQFLTKKYEDLFNHYIKTNELDKFRR